MCPEEDAKGALDDAMAEVFEERLRKLCGGRGKEACAEKVVKALDSIGLLRAGGKPDYDKWDAPFYVTWYQPRQVHLVYTVLKQSAPTGDPRPLLIVDVGCGAGAVQMAAAILAAEGHPSVAGRAVSVWGIDPSKPMREIGDDLFLAFGCAAEERGYRKLLDVIDPMMGRGRTFASYDLPGDSLKKEELTRRAKEGVCWLTSVHAAYDESKEEVKGLLDKLRTTIEPEYELATTDDTKSCELSYIFDAADPQSEELRPEPALSGDFCRTTKRRQRLSTELAGSWPPGKSKEGLLKSCVRWDGRKNCVKKDSVLVRRQVQ